MTDYAELRRITEISDQEYEEALSRMRRAYEAGVLFLDDLDRAIRRALRERDELAAMSDAARVDAEPVVRFNDDGTLDEVVGRGLFHLEQMGDGHWWMQLGPHMVNLTARGKIRANFGRNEAAIDQARGKEVQS